MQPGEARFVTRLSRGTLALVLAGGRGTRLHELTRWRAKPAVFFGGKFRIIDFLCRTASTPTFGELAS